MELRDHSKRHVKDHFIILRVLSNVQEAKSLMLKPGI